MDTLRIDKWLWAARFYKTRSLAVDEINKGRVLVNEQTVKPARDVRPGDALLVRIPAWGIESPLAANQTSLIVTIPESTR